MNNQFVGKVCVFVCVCVCVWPIIVKDVITKIFLICEIDKN